MGKQVFRGLKIQTRPISTWFDALSMNFSQNLEIFVLEGQKELILVKIRSNLDQIDKNYGFVLS